MCSEPEWSEEESGEWLRRAKRLIAYATKDLRYVPEIIYYEESKVEEEKDEEWARLSHRHQHSVQRYNQIYCVLNKLKRFELSEVQRGVMSAIAYFEFGFEKRSLRPVVFDLGRRLLRESFNCFDGTYDLIGRRGLEGNISIG
ncbi:hypothetical protein CHS0354_021594 [Potamilus streckersoni]|uniref:Uncharacterized protein n=1 Tax=Potamilus streckersoni TaxID=2493646 RepID=A0AAE0SPL0_9BIVA|nr:hypothetical protein CHS0354_021594 [Potamilus streckersoni]